MSWHTTLHYKVVIQFFFFLQTKAPDLEMFKLTWGVASSYTIGRQE